MTSSYYTPPVYLHTSTFQSPHIKLTIRSPSVEHVEDPKFLGQSIPVFNGKHNVEGTVITSIPAVISTVHQLEISIEGAFFWIGPQKEEPQTLPLTSPRPKRIKHVFLSSTVTIPLTPYPLDSPLKPLTPLTPLKTSMSIRSVLQEGIRNTFSRRTTYRASRRTAQPPPKANAEGTYTAPDSAEALHSFNFPLPVINDHEIPSTISVSRLCSGGIRGRWYAEGAQIAYKLTAQVYPLPVGEEDTRTFEEQLEAPLFIESSGIVEELKFRHSWSHTRLVCLKNLPFTCMLALPERTSYSRSDTITFYVFFTTSPKSEALVRRIIRRATVRVSLIRQLRLDPGLAISGLLPHIRYAYEDQETTQWEQSGSPFRHTETRTPKIFDWQKKPSHAVRTDDRGTVSGVTASGPLLQNKPLPALPNESSSMYEDVICSATSEGFPKRVANKDPYLSFETSSGPDGVFKGHLRLSNELSNTIDWPGLSLSYFVEASVLFENELVRARHVVRLAEAYI
ncbi:hypothetical protein JB92DRAFT_3032609 [Gautieria morchelliformis]|nr:hypothetical protein JB92DRAFT_3032609 [Gautieria morchelliformis]